MSRALHRLGRFAVRRRWLVLVGWLVAAAVLWGAAGGAGRRVLVRLPHPRRRVAAGARRPDRAVPRGGRRQRPGGRAHRGRRPAHERGVRGRLRPGHDARGAAARLDRRRPDGRRALLGRGGHGARPRPVRHRHAGARRDGLPRARGRGRAHPRRRLPGRARRRPPAERRAARDRRRRDARRRWRGRHPADRLRLGHRHGPAHRHRGRRPRLQHRPGAAGRRS